MEKGINEIVERLGVLATDVEARGETVFDETMMLLGEDWNEIGDDTVEQCVRVIEDALTALVEECKATAQALLDVQAYLGKE